MRRMKRARMRDNYENDSWEYDHNDGDGTAATYYSPEDIQGIIAGGKVRGGVPAYPGQIPHQVSIQTRWKRHFCGGSVIHPLILLTAAHCFDTQNILRNLRAVTGQQNSAVAQNTEQIRKISHLIIHENWNKKTYDNDIALVVLDKPLEFNNYTQPIRIPQANPALPPTAKVSGWGHTNLTKQTPNVLQVTTIYFRTRAECSQTYQSRGPPITDNMICAGGRRDACEGDSGGPLTCTSLTGEPFLCGIVSWGASHCVQRYSPGVYTDVSKYHRWITSHVQEVVESHPTTQIRSACGSATVLAPQITCITCSIDNRKAKTNGTYMAVFHLHADIEYRYSRTQVTSIMVNPNVTNSEEVTFSVYLPDTAFISNFSMNINGTAHGAYAEEREAARWKYINSKKGGSAAGIVESSFLHENLFNLTTHIPPVSVVTFALTYEELLPRRVGMYEQAIHIDLEKVREAGSYEITSTVSDSRNIAVLRTLGMSSALTIDEEIESVNTVWDGNLGTISWSPNASEPNIPQRFVLQYDIEPEADSSSGQIIIRDGYFAHFFSPTHIPPFETHLIFVLEASSSMDGTVFSQMKEGVVSILNVLDRKDHSSIITFNDNVTVEFENKGYGHTKRAKNFTMSLRGNGGANLHGALITAFNITSGASSSSFKPIMVLFSTGNVTTTAGISSHAVIQYDVAVANWNQNVPIFSLVYGPSPDFAFLRKISLQNNGFARKLPPESDHLLELTQFYTEISSPLLEDLSFTYNTSNTPFIVSDLTATSFPSFFKGSSIVVMGKLEPRSHRDRNSSSELLNCHEKRDNVTFGVHKEPGIFSATVLGRSNDGWREFTSSQTLHCHCLLKATSSFMERRWSYLKIKEALQQVDTMTEDQLTDITKAGCEGPAEYAQQLALKYGFVTPVTSLVVVQPGFTNIVVESPEENILAVKAAVRSRLGGPEQNTPRGNIPCHMRRLDHRIESGDHNLNETRVGNNSSSVAADAFHSSVLNGTLLHSRNSRTSFGFHKRLSSG